MANQQDTVDGVHRSPLNGIKVVIVGAGIGGLNAAMECWRKGCEVLVLERSPRISVQGDFFTLPPSGISNLKHYPSFVKEYKTATYDCVTSMWTPAGQQFFSTLPEWRRGNPKHAANDLPVSFINLRAVWAGWQTDQCKRLGIPIMYSKQVTEVEETENGIKVISGEDVYPCDLCIVANGISSSMKGLISSGENVHVQDTGYAIARVAFPRTAIDPKSPAWDLVKEAKPHPEFRVYIGDDLHLILFITPDHVAWVFTHVNDGSATESWSAQHDPASLLSHLLDVGVKWDPAVVSLLEQTPQKVVDWQLKFRDVAYQWTSDIGRIIRLGDAAHTFLPTAGNGAVQALEDGISLAECLRIAGKENITQATKAHNKLRFERVSVLQHAGFLNREELHSVDVNAFLADPHNPKWLETGFFKQGRWVWGHDPERYARENYSAVVNHLETGAPFQNTNLPPGHVYEPWSLESEKKRMMARIPSQLKRNGYWGVDESYFQ